MKKLILRKIKSLVQCHRMRWDSIPHQPDFKAHPLYHFTAVSVQRLKHTLWKEYWEFLVWEILVLIAFPSCQLLMWLQTHAFVSIPGDSNKYHDIMLNWLHAVFLVSDFHRAQEGRKGWKCRGRQAIALQTDRFRLYVLVVGTVYQKDLSCQHILQTYRAL